MNNGSKFIRIPDDFEGYNNELFLIPRHYQDSVASVLIPCGLIKDRIEKLANDIFHDILEHGRDPLTTLCILKGGYLFYSQLQDKLNVLNRHNGERSLQMSMDFIRVKSYENTSSTSEVKIMGMDTLDTLKGKHLLIVEDIIDTGKTMKKLLDTIKTYEPKSVTVACLLRKRTPLSSGYMPDYVGFEIPDKFVIGHGFDYNEYFRDMTHICVINEHGIEKFKK